MKGLPTLIRLRRQELDEKRRALADLEQQDAAICRNITNLDDQVVCEQAVAGSAQDVRFAYENFSLAARARRKGLVDSLADLRTELEAVREVVVESFRDYKKLDIAEDNIQKRLGEERNRREIIDADELGLEIYRRANH